METPLFFSVHGSPLGCFGDSSVLMLVRRLRQLVCASSFHIYPFNFSDPPVSHSCNFPHIYPCLLTLLSLEWLKMSFSSQRSALETATLVAGFTMSASTACCPGLSSFTYLHLRPYVKCSLNILRSIQSNLVRTEREKANIYLLSCHFFQMNELNILIALKINYLLSLGQL